MFDIPFVLTVLVSYFIGSLSFSYWIGRIFYKIDIREHGSGNAGATNTGRILGKKAGITVLALDILKGTFCVALGAWFFPDDRALLVSTFFGLACLLGHIFPIFSNFKGGKGVATTLGVIMGVDWRLALLAILFFVLCFLATKIVSLSSLLSSLLVCSSVFFLLSIDNDVLKYFSVGVVVMFFLTHHENIGRIMRGEEKKFVLKRPS